MIAEWLTKYTLKTGKIHWILRIFLWIQYTVRKGYASILGEFSLSVCAEKNAGYIISHHDFSKINRPTGISGFARLRNAEEFLEVVIESHIDLCDEIVLVNNTSTDATEQICLMLQKRYPHKIRYFQYTPELVRIGSPLWTSTPEDSVHSFVYYSNWALSQTRYSHVWKIDDDVLFVGSERLRQKIRTIPKSKTSFGLVIPQLNVYSQSGHWITPLQGESRFLPIIAGIYGDHGIFPMSTKLYFTKGASMERWIFPVSVQVTEVGALHLKGLKRNRIANVEGERAVRNAALETRSIYAPLPEKYQQYLNDYGITSLGI